jgi:hypothetical protein
MSALLAVCVCAGGSLPTLAFISPSASVPHLSHCSQAPWPISRYGFCGEVGGEFPLGAEDPLAGVLPKTLLSSLEAINVPQDFSGVSVLLLGPSR